MRNMILLSGLSKCFFPKTGEVVLSSIITRTLCVYLNKHRAHHMIIFLHSERKFLFVTF